MTACVNKHSKRVAAVISASLVGALSLGIAPVAAMANEDDGLQLLIGNTTTDIAGGTVSSYTDNNGKSTDGVFSWDGKAHYLLPVEITTETGSVVPFDANKFVYGYYKVVEGTGDVQYDGQELDWIDPKNADKEIVDEGTYYLAVASEEDAGQGPSACAMAKFEIQGTNLSNVKVVSATDKQSGLTFTGQPIAPSTGYVFTLNGEQIVSSGNFDYTVYKDDQPVEDDSPVDAGSYYIRLEGKGDYAGQVANVPFEVKPVDLSTAEVQYNNDAEGHLYSTLGEDIPDYVTAIEGVDLNGASDSHVNFAPTGYKGESQGWITLADGSEVNSVNGESNPIVLTLSFIAEESSSSTPSKDIPGKYVYKLTAKNADGKDCTNIVGEKTVTVVRYKNDATIKYDGKVAYSASVATPISTEHFSTDYIDVRDSNGKKLAYAVEYLDADGKQVEASATQWPGSYTAVITVADDDYVWGGKAEVSFKVNAIEIKDADAYVTYKGEVFDEDATVDVYSGEDLISNLAIKAYDEDGEEVPADAFDLEITDSEGNVVTELVNAGTYTATVKEKADSMYRLDSSDPDVTFTISPVVIDGAYDDDDTATDNAVARFVGTMTFGQGKDHTYAWTGEAIVPTFEYDVTWGDYKGSEDWKALPTEAYKVKFFDEKDNEVDECVDPGWYKMAVTDNADDDNYDVEFNVTFKISNDRVFLDVTNDKWYSEYVYTAAENEWMTGFDGTNLFGPDQDIKRGDVAVVLWKMAGKPSLPNNENWYTEEAGWNTGFGDVDGNMYYAQAIAWAKASGLVTGDTGTGMFRPDATISRQELAAMLARYAAKCGEDTAVDTDEVLAAYEDASSVADWARGDVAYLASTGVMGSDSPLRGSDPITRAEVATMVVRLDGVFDFDLMPINPSNPNERPNQR